MSHKPFLVTPQKLAERRETIQSFKARANMNRTRTEKAADWFTEFFGTVPFLLVNAVFFGAWIAWNLGLIPGLSPIDPFPFGLLTMVVSLEAIFLAIVVLISQNREARVTDLREEVELYISTYAESEITKIMYLLTLLLEKNGIDISKDAELQHMLECLESEKIEQEFRQQM